MNEFRLKPNLQQFVIFKLQLHLVGIIYVGPTVHHKEKHI